jgi:hypothetical protein
MQTRQDLGVAARCILAAFGTEDIENDKHDARKFVGALLLAEVVTDLRIIRRALTVPQKEK